MKKMILAAALVAAMSASAELKIGTVDMLKLVRNHPSYEFNKTFLTNKEKDFQEKLDKTKAEIDALQEEGRKTAEQIKNPMLSQSAKDKIEKDLMEIQNKYVAAQQKLRSEAMDSQQQLQDLEADLLKSTTSDLRKNISAFAAENGYDLILDAAATPFAKKDLDVTAAVQKCIDDAAAKTQADKAAKENDEGK